MRSPRRDPHHLAGAYALDAITGRELDRFERHLEQCPECAREVRGLTETAAEMALAATAAPPEQLRARVLAALPHVRQARAAPEAADLTPPRARAARPAWRWGLAAGLAAAVAAVIALSVALVSAQNQLSAARTEQQALTQLLSAPGARIITARTSVGGAVTAVVAAAQEKMIVITRDLPEPPAAKVYQVWLIGPSGVRSAGLLSWRTGGSAAPLLATGVRRGDRIGMTVEPSGGSAQPTTKPIVLTPLVS